MAITTSNTGAALTGALRRKGADAVTVKITSPCCLHGRHCGIGEVVEVDPRMGRTLIANGKAVPVADAPAKPMVREPAPATRDGEADPGQHTAAAGPACSRCGQDLTDRRRKRLEDGEGGVLCVACAKE